MKLLKDLGQEPDYAPFYLTRANLMVPKDDVRFLADLQMAAKLAPDNWRAANMLIQYYSEKKDYKTMLTLTTSAYKKFRGTRLLKYNMCLLLSITASTQTALNFLMQ